MSLSHGDFFYYHYNLWITKNFNAQLLSCVRLFATPWTVARQAPLSMGLSWQEYWSGLPFPPPFDLLLLLLLLLLSRFSRVRLCVTPETAAHQASPSLGFSRQEHWSGLPFPSPMHESEE